MSLQLGILLSGSGTNFQAIIDRINQGVLQVEVPLVISNNPQARGLSRAAHYSIPSKIIDQRDFQSREEHDQAVIEAFQKQGVKAVALAGYMRLVSRNFIKAFSGQVLNIHPALLPSFKGLKAQEKAVNYGVKISGATVHFVDEYLDHGPIIIQAALSVPAGLSGQDLSDRILKLEHRIYPQAIQWLSDKRLQIEQDRLFFREENRSKAELNLPYPCLIEPPLEEGF